MTIEYVLLLTAMIFFGLKAYVSTPGDAFRKSGPLLAARVEKQLTTGDGFLVKGRKQDWNGK